MKPRLRFWMIACAAIAVASAPTAFAQNLLWSQADVNTILLGQEFIGFDAYNSGRIHDLLILQNTGSILVGAEKGGVWLVPSNGSAIPVSNSWDRPDINAMAFGFGNEKHVFAGGSGLHVTDYNSLFPYLSWFDISPQGGVLDRADVIYKVTTVTHDTADGPKLYVVIATSRGIWTSELPPVPAGPYNWQLAAGGGNLPFGPYSGLASGPDGSGIVVAGFFKAFSALYSGTSTPAIYQGTFDASGTLNLSAVNIAATASTAQQPGMIGYVSLDSCASQPNRMYASVYDTNGALFDLLRSDDSGVNWVGLSKTFDDGDPNNDLINWSNFMGNAGSGGWIKHISVAPSAPDSVTVPGFGGIRTGNGGTTWHSMGASWVSKGKLLPQTLSYHADWHVARQHPANHLVVFAGTDGGLLNSYGLLFGVLDFDHFYSDFNSRLHTLEFSSNPVRNFEGESDAESGVAEGLIAGGLQDNGDVFLRMNPLASTPWTRFVVGDGGQNQFFNLNANTGAVLHSSVLGWNALIATAVLNFSPFVTMVDFTPPVKKDPNGKKRPEGLLGQVRAVYRPSYMKGGRLMYAVVGEQASIKTDLFPNSIFGLFAKSNNFGDMEWEHLGDLPVKVTTTAAYDGQVILSGGEDGGIYALDPKNGNVQKLPVNAPFQGGTAYRILYRLPALPICGYSAFPTNLPPQAAVLQFNGVQWNPILKFNDQTIQDIQVDESVSPEAIYVATDSRVYSSPDAGKNWFTDSNGLPERFHGSQLKIVRYSNGEKWLYLTTYGRSVWAANMAGHPMTH